MKKLLFSLSFVLMTLPSFAAMLQPHGHSMCLNGLKEQCKEGTELYYADQGCACLSSGEFFDPDFCMSAMIKCVGGTKFSGLHQLGSQGSKVYAGCGCFSVNKGPGPRGTVVLE